MTSRDFRHRALLFWFARQSFWILLVLIHIPALVGATRSLLLHPDLLHGVSLLGLVLTVGCFVLKLCGVTFFSHGNTRSRALIFLLIAALVHHEAAASAAEKVLAGPAPIILLSFLAVAGIRRLQPGLTRLKSRLAALLAHHLRAGSYLAALELLDRGFRETVLTHQPRIPRAPPA